MANTKTGAIWVCETAAEVVATGTFVRIIGIHFVGTANADVCLVSDASGNKIWGAKLGTVGTSGYNASLVLGGDGIVVNGFTITTIDHGTIYVYLGKL